ncbi:MAG TPA: hypothetical protein VKG83_09965 [Mycobacterium sp.]|nr:hypothetical protein [Mycobacterium sp.]
MATLDAGGLSTGQVAVTTAATLVCTAGASEADNDGVLLVSSTSATVFVGGSSSVTATNGFPIGLTPVLFPSSGAAPMTVYAICSSSTATVSYALPG